MSPIGPRRKYGWVEKSEELSVIGVNLEDCMRKLTELEVLKVLYAKPNLQKGETGEAIFGKDWTIWQAKPNIPGHPPILIFDVDAYVYQGRNEYALQPYEGDFTDAFQSVPQKTLNIITKLAEESIPKVKTPLTSTVLTENKLLYTPVPQLRDIEILKRIDWMHFIENEVLSYKAKKDERLKTVCKALLPRGVEIRYNPHALISTGTWTGKTEFFERAGTRRDKVTAISLIGTVSKQHVSYGLVHNQELPVCIEQIESQSASEILSFMSTFMEMGKASASTAYGTLDITGKCSFIITANPTGYETDRIATFRSLIDTLSRNYLALGRRFGIIVYGGAGEYKKVKPIEPLDMVEWDKRFRFYRAVEEYAYPAITALFRDKAVRRWLETSIKDYSEQINKLLMQIEDKAVKQFFDTHGSGAYRHIRGAGLNCAIVDLMPKLADLKRINVVGIPESLVSEVLNKAEEHLNHIVSINLESVANIPKTLETKEQVKAMIRQRLPKYLKEIVSTLERYKEESIQYKIPIPKEKALSDLRLFHQREIYPYWSTIEYNLAKGNVDVHNNYLEKYFGFRVVKKTDKIYAIRFA